MQIVLEEISKDFAEKFVAFAYEDICRNTFADLCRNGEISFMPSRIGSYWLNDFDGDTEIDVMAVDHQNKRIFAGECKYHAQPVDVPVYFVLKKRLMALLEFAKCFLGMMLSSECSVKAALRSACLILQKKTPGCFLSMRITWRNLCFSTNLHAK